MATSVDIYYATGNGNSRRLAHKLESEIVAAGTKASVHNLGDCKPADLQDASLAVFLISTWGEGDPPPDAAEFFEALALATEPLSNLTCCVVGLGDSCFRHFCGASVRLEDELRRLDATTAMPLEKLDAYFAPGFAAWQGRFLDWLSQRTERPVGAALP